MLDLQPFPCSPASALPGRAMFWGGTEVAHGSAVFTTAGMAAYPDGFWHLNPTI